VVPVHGLFCSTFYWRRTTEALSREGHYVYAPDLLGHGKSAKPTEDGGTALWAEQLEAFIRYVKPMENAVVLGGNSVGNLAAATAPDRDLVREISVFNFGLGLNVRSVERDSKCGGFNEDSRQVLSVLPYPLATLSWS